MQHRRRQSSQLAGLIKAQQRQQAGIFHFTRVGAIDPGHIAPDGDAGDPGQRANLGSRVVGTVTAQQHGFSGIVAGDKAGHHQPFVGVLRHQLL